MTDVPSERSLTVSALWLLGAKTIGFGFMFLLPLLLVRQLSQHDFGVYKQLFLVVGTAVSLLQVYAFLAIAWFWEIEPPRIGYLTLLPALLGFAGHKIDAVRLPGRRSTRHSLTRETMWHRWGRHVSAHPWRYLAIGAVILGLLSAPLFSLRLGMTDNGTVAESQTIRRSYDLLAGGFGPGFNGPLTVVADVSQGGADAVSAIGRAGASLRGRAGAATRGRGEGLVQARVPLPGRRRSGWTGPRTDGLAVEDLDPGRDWSGRNGDQPSGLRRSSRCSCFVSGRYGNTSDVGDTSQALNIYFWK